MIAKKTKIAFVLLGFLITLIILYRRALPDLNRTRQREIWTSRTTPLPQETIDVLCANFQLGNDHILCNGEREVYGPDFYSVIRSAFLPRAGGLGNFDLVEEKIGQFLVSCDPEYYINSLERSIYICYYDIRGDGEYHLLIFYYYPENTVYSMAFPLGFDS